jgi:hypothetical protein
MEDVYTAGIETIFCIDILRQLSEATSDNNLFTCLSQIKSNSALVALPRLFSSFCGCIRRSRGTLFGSKNDISTTGSLDQLRLVGMRFYASCDQFLQSSEANVWSTRAALLNIVEQENLFSAAHAENSALLKKTSKSSVSMLEISYGKPLIPRLNTSYQITDSGLAVQIYETLCALANIDYDIVDEDITTILPIAAKVSNHLLY